MLLKIEPPTRSVIYNDFNIHYLKKEFWPNNGDNIINFLPDT